MMIYRFLIISVLFLNVNGFIDQKYNESDYEMIQQFLEYSFKAFNIPELLNPDKSNSDNSPAIKKQISRENLINIGLPTIPHLLPTALPKLPTIKIPDIIPKTLLTLAPFKIPTIKLPTFPHILPTAFPTLFPKPSNPSEAITPNTPYTLPYPLPSDVVPIPFLNNNTDPGGNLVCLICQDAVNVVKKRFFSIEKTVRAKISDILGNIPTDPPFSPVCTNCLDGIISLKNTIAKIATFAKITIGTTIDKICNHIVPEFDFLEAICHVIDQNIEEKVYKFLMGIHDKIDEKFMCHMLSFCPK